MSDYVKILTQLSLPVCMYPTCHFAVKADYLAAHLKETHGVSQEAAVSAVVEVLRAIGSVQQTAAEKEIAVKYMKAGQPGNEAAEVLHPLPFLRVAEGRRCLFCPYIAISADTLFKHAQANHGQDASATNAAEMFRSAPKLTVQSIFGGSKKRWFEVSECAGEEESGSSPVRYMKAFRGASGLEHIAEDASRMNAFLATVRFDSVLQEHSLSVEEGWSLVHGCVGEEMASAEFMKRCVTRYFAGAFRACQRNPFITSHNVQGSRLRVCLERNTLERYEAETMQLLRFAWNCISSERRFVPQRVSKGMEDLLHVSKEEHDTVMRKLHALMCTLFLDVVEPRDGDIGFVGVYVACASIVGGPSRELLRFAEASEVSPVLAALKYSIRIVAVSEVIGLGETRQGAESWNLIESRTSDSRLDTGATYIAYLSHLAHSIMPSEGTRCRFRICPRHKKCGYIDDVEISLQRLGDAVRSMQKRAARCLEEQLLKGLKWDTEFCAEASALSDGLQNSARGFWFGNHPSNSRFVSKWKMMLWKHRGSDFWSSKDGELNVDACNEFLAGCEGLQQILFALIQLTAGSPSRASECSGLRVLNDVAASRNIYLCDGQIVITSFYSKTRSLNDGTSKPIARFPDSVTQAYILAYLLIVRPLEYCIVRALHDLSGRSDTSDDQRLYLFARRGGAVDAKVLCDWFKSKLGEAGIENLAVSQYRQYQTGMVKNFDIADKAEKEIATYAQAGHSSETAHRLYGVSEADFRHLTGTELEAYRMSSQRWHEELGLEHGPASVGRASRVDKVGSGTSSAPSGDTDSLRSSDESLASLLVERLERMETLLSGLLSRKRTGECGSEYEGEPEDSERRAKRKKNSSLTDSLDDEARFVAEEMRAALSRFVAAKDGHKTDFKSAGQRKAIVMARLRQTDGLIVLPTGGGKSLTFMLPCYVETNTVTVVIVPLVALQHDMLARCTRAGIDAVLWRDRERVGVRIVIASIEHVETEEYAQYIRAVSSNSKLARIVIDEAHLVYMWCDFREKMKSLGMSVRPAGVRVPLLMLTATAPPQLAPRIASMCGAGLFKVIRADASRPNIRYSCVRVHAGGSAASFYMAMASKVNEILDRYRAGPKGDRVVVYVLTRGAVETLGSLLKCDTKTSVYAYHAGLSPENRGRSQDEWSCGAEDGDKFKVMIATSAFGTGIDYSGIRAVIHVTGARNMIEFYQESGRAGRDGRPAESIVLAAAENTVTSTDDSEGEALHLQSWKGNCRLQKQHEFGDFSTYVNAESTCRRVMAEGFCQGANASAGCKQLRARDDRTALCDVCERLTGDEKEEKSTCPSTSQAQGSSQNSSGSEDRHARKNGDGMYQAGKAVATSAAEAQSRRSHADADVSALKRLALKIGSVCAVCTVTSRTEVRHGAAGAAAGMHRLPCRRDRCDRCCMRGHYWGSCNLNPKPEWNRGCVRCGISKHLGLNVHPDGQFGKPSCGIQTLVSIALLSWDDAKRRESMIASIPELSRLSSISSFAAWLRCEGTPDAGGSTATGLARLTAWIDTAYSSGNAQK